MTLPREFPGGVRGDGSADERSGADAARDAAGFGSEAADDRDGSAAAEAWTPSGVRSGGCVCLKKGAPPLASTDPAIQQGDLHLGAERAGQGGNRQTRNRFRLPDGRLAIRHNGPELAYRTLDKIRQVDQGAIVDNKRLGPTLAMIRDEQLRREPQRRSGPRRRDAHLFKIG